MSSKKLFLGVSSGEEYVFVAGFFPRVCACLLDLSILFLTAALAIKGLCFEQALNFIRNVESVPDLTICGHLTLFSVILLYFVLLEAAFGVTPGKHILKLRTTDLSGNTLSLLQRICRNCIKSIFLTLSLNGIALAVKLFPESTMMHSYGLFIQLGVFIGLLLPGFTEQKQTLYDKWCKTLVRGKTKTCLSVRTATAVLLSFIFLGSGIFVFSFYTMSAIAEVLEATEDANINIRKRKMMELAKKSPLIFDQGILSPVSKNEQESDKKYNQKSQHNQTNKNSAAKESKPKKETSIGQRFISIKNFVMRITNYLKSKIWGTTRVRKKQKNITATAPAKKKSNLNEIYQLLEKTEKSSPKSKKSPSKATADKVKPKKQKASGLVAF